MKTGQEIYSLTGLRGFAAVMVVIAHAEAESGVFAIARGQPAVDIFFVLSGFVISYVYIGRDKPIDWASFTMARFARIYPLHIVTAVFMACASLVFAHVTGGPAPAHVNAVQALRELTLAMAMPVVGAEKLWNFPAWSISVEWWVYFTLFPLLALFGRRISLSWATLLYLATAGGLAWLVLWKGDIHVTRGWFAFCRALIGFGGGWLAFRYTARDDMPRPSPWVATALALASLAAVLLTPFLAGVDAWYLLPAYPVLIYALAVTVSPASNFLSSRTMVWLGNISFSIYLIHPLAMNTLEAVNKVAFPIQGRITWVVLTLALTIVGSVASYYLFEGPMRDWAKRRRSQSTLQANTC